MPPKKKKKLPEDSEHTVDSLLPPILSLPTPPKARNWRCLKRNIISPNTGIVMNPIKVKLPLICRMSLQSSNVLALERFKTIGADKITLAFFKAYKDSNSFRKSLRPLRELSLSTRHICNKNMRTIPKIRGLRVLDVESNRNIERTRFYRLVVRFLPPRLREFA